MIDARARAVLDGLERHDPRERERGSPRAVWLAAAARAVGAVVVTLEIDPAKVRRATASLREAGVDGVAAIVEGDAFAFLRERRGPGRFVFLRAGEGGHA